MPWDYFWHVIVQIILAFFLLSPPVSFAVWAVGSAISGRVVAHHDSIAISRKARGHDD